MLPLSLEPLITYFHWLIGFISFDPPPVQILSLASIGSIILAFTPPGIARVEAQSLGLPSSVI